MAKFRTWLLLQPEPVGFAIGMVPLALVVVALTSIYWPVRGSQALEGRLVGWRIHDDYEGSARLALVRAGARTFTVRMPVRYPCQVGDVVALQRERLWWGGSTISASRPPCPVRMGASG